MQNIFILTGAGISAESGLKTFRDADGLWEGHRLEDVATPEAFISNPELVQDFYNQRRSQLLNVAPNPAHLALVRLQEHFSHDLTIVTQNVDDLHERAGMQDVIHMHGELLKKRCTHCEVISECLSEIDTHNVCEDCGTTGSMRPHIVWFGEMPLQMDEIYEKLSKADLFVSIGTSGVVYPAASFAAEAKQKGAHLIEVNLTGTDISPVFDEHLHGSASETLPKLVDRLTDVASC